MDMKHGFFSELTYLSLFSGIEAASCAWSDLPLKPVGFSEVEPFPCNVLRKHYPDVPNLGDITKITMAQLHELGRIDLIVGGSPCQGFSVAGNRQGLNDVRSKLAISYISMVSYVRPSWILWENVPGVLNINGGMDFRSFTSALVQLGYDLSWRILDAQYFGVPQQRRRVYLVGYLGDWRRPNQVLFERTGVSGDTAPSSTARPDYSATPADVLRETVYDIAHSSDVVRTYVGATQTLSARMGTGGNNVPLVIQDGKLRKLTPRECLRLQGFPSDWFDDVDGYSDMAAYKAIGNSMAVPVMRWVGRRIVTTSYDLSTEL